MKKIVSQMMVSVDGYYAGKQGELDWHKVDEEHNAYAVEMLDNTSTLLFGRKTYQLMEAYWPTEQSKEDSPAVAARMNGLPKVVFSKTLDFSSWNKTILVKEDIENYLNGLKKEAEKDLMIIGSGELVSYLTQARLIDEYHIIVSPIFLGEGIAFLEDLSERIPLTLIRTKQFKTGNLLLCYRLAE